jgi:hypothetical protein
MGSGGLGPGGLGVGGLGSGGLGSEGFWPGGLGSEGFWPGGLGSGGLERSFEDELCGKAIASEIKAPTSTKTPVTIARMCIVFIYHR